MIDRFVIRPFLALFTFVKRNPLLATLLIIILFLLPPLIVAVITATRWALDLVKTVLGIKAAEAAAKFASTVITWMQNNSWACPAFALVIGTISPLVGGLLAAWCFADKFKTGPQLEVLPLPSTLPEQPEITPDLGDTSPLDDYFNKGGIYV